MIIHELATYEVSRDYARLVELMKLASIICIIDALPHDAYLGCGRRIAQTVYSCSEDGTEIFQIQNDDRLYIYDDKEAFKQICWSMNVEFIEPIWKGC
jgi:hypothetical protein